MSTPQNGALESSLNKRSNERSTPEKRPLEVEEKQPLRGKKKRKLYKKDPNNLTRDEYFQIYGENGTITLRNTLYQHLKGSQTKLKVHNLHHLIIWLFSEDEVPTPRWVELKHKYAVKKVVMIQVDGLTEDTATPLPIFKDIFTPGQRYPLKLDVTPAIEDIFLKVNMTKLETKKDKKKRDQSVSKMIKNKKSWKVTDFLMSLDELKENEYPVSGNEEYKDCLDTKSWVIATDPRKVLAIDCEMVESANGMELCQCVVVDWEGNALMNELVMPRREITTYNTQWSGVTAETLKGVTTRVEDIQVGLKKWITSSTILIGHSLDNDLRVLKLIHSRVVDTSVIYPHNKEGFKYSLKHLANKYLKRDIQSGHGTSGHNPVEDAMAALDLVKLKVIKGPSLGVLSARPVKRGLAKTIRGLKRNMHVLGSPRVISRFKTDPVGLTLLPASTSNEMLLNQAPKIIGNPEMHLVWAQITIGLNGIEEDDVQELVNNTITTLWKATPPKSLVVVHTGRRSLKRLKELRHAKVLGKLGKGPRLNFKQATELKRMERDLPNHHFWLAVKNSPEYRSIL